jgi:hypothetical protein
MSLLKIKLALLLFIGNAYPEAIAAANRGMESSNDEIKKAALDVFIKLIGNRCVSAIAGANGVALSVIGGTNEKLKQLGRALQQQVLSLAHGR